MKLKQLDIKTTFENPHNGNIDHYEYSYILKNKKSYDTYIVLSPNGEWETISLNNYFSCEKIDSIEIKNDIDKKLIDNMKKYLKLEAISYKKKISKLEKIIAQF